ncbi:MAG: ribonuclease D [Ferruginibacter sp.]|nr:ribonuclease D [Ferruginibacter sp.]
MDLKNTKNEDVLIKLINTEQSLLALTAILQHKSAFGFDTEFDRFYREYGFKLFLIQIFDGEICYLVDPLSIKNLAPLWAVFQNEKICKIAYSCSEDVQLLKINGCHIKNIYDLQMVAKLCNHSSNSFSDLIKDIYGVSLDKSMQKSNWRTRPLNTAQQVYASNDVIWLLKLKDFFTAIAADKGVQQMIEEENKCCEEVTVTEYAVKLSSKQTAKYSPYHQKILLNLFKIRDQIAKKYNMPPFYIVSDNTLEEIVDDKAAFINWPFKKGFCSRLLNDEENKNLFYDAIDIIDGTIANLPVRKPYSSNNERVSHRALSKDIVEEKCKKISDVVLKEYGQTASDYILRGLKKSLLQMPFADIKLKDYQQKVIVQTCNNLNIEL